MLIDPKIFSTKTVLSGLLLILTGCAAPPSGGSGGSGGSGTPGLNITGNWEFKATPSKGASPFTLISGFIQQTGSSGTASNFTTAAFQVKPGSCLANAVKVPFQGGFQGNRFNVSSFPVDGQTITLSASEDSTLTKLTGTYGVVGGCADGAQGEIIGVQYAALNGSYGGSITGNNSTEAIELSLTQLAQGTGDGLFLLSGTGTFQGLSTSCFTGGTLSYPDSFVIGSAAHLVFNTNESISSVVTMDGSFDTAADTITFASVSIVGGNCAGPLGGVVLNLHK